MNILEDNKLTTSEKWRLVGHFLFSMGTMCLSISSLLKLASDGDLPDAPLQTQTRSSPQVSGREAVHDFFRRP